MSPDTTSPLCPSITAFPVLARILTELKLLRNPVGLTVLAAGVGNDVVGWIVSVSRPAVCPLHPANSFSSQLLALAVALANAGNGVSAVYILLCAVGFGLLLFYIVRPVYGCRYLHLQSLTFSHY